MLESSFEVISVMKNSYHLAFRKSLNNMIVCKGILHSNESILRLIVKVTLSHSSMDGNDSWKFIISDQQLATEVKLQIRGI